MAFVNMANGRRLMEYSFVTTFFQNNEYVFWIDGTAAYTSSASSTIAVYGRYTNTNVYKRINRLAKACIHTGTELENGIDFVTTVSTAILFSLSVYI